MIKFESTNYLTGLRGYSALAVFFIHSGGLGLRELGSIGNSVVDAGKFGVISFFVLSAFTLSMSIDSQEKFNYGQYMLRRFARIFPVYVLACTCFWMLGGNAYYQDLFGVKPYDWIDLTLHLTFLNIAFDQYKTSIIGVEWTVPIEMWVYVFLPFIYVIIQRLSLILQFVFFTLSVLTTIYCMNLIVSDNLSVHWSIFKYIYCFIAGIFTYNAWKSTSKDMLLVKKLLLVYCLILIISISKGIAYPEPLVTGFIMLLILVLKTFKLGNIFEARPLMLIGKVCFPFYLLHFPIINYLNKFNLPSLVLFVSALFFTLAISSFIHFAIEAPILDKVKIKKTNA